MSTPVFHPIMYVAIPVMMVMAVKAVNRLFMASPVGRRLVCRTDVLWTGIAGGEFWTDPIAVGALWDHVVG